MTGRETHTVFIVFFLALIALAVLLLGSKYFVGAAVVMGTLSGVHFFAFGTSGAEHLEPYRALRDSRLGPPGDTLGTWCYGVMHR